MRFLNDWWGINQNIAPLEIAARSAVMFIVALVLIRLAGMRPFGKGESFDKIITFLIGAILSRGVVGATPFFSTITAVIVIILIHKLLSRISIYNKFIGKLTKGNNYVLYRNGKFVKENMVKANISDNDIQEELRLQCNSRKMDNIQEIYLERTGKISFIKKESD
jgi:uncharacterized membrane protein YcaP (DUF421 family)